MPIEDKLAELTDSLVMVAGGVRRVEEWVDRLDLIVSTDAPRPVLDFLGSTAALSETDRVSCL